MYTIDKDHLTEMGFDDSRVGHGDHLKAPITADTYGAMRFHTYDDDGNPVYSGWVVDDHDYPWDSALDFAAADAGATVIKDGQHKDVIS